MHRQCLILADSTEALVELCGISLIERVLRTVQRCGFRQAIVLSSTPEIITKHLLKPSWARTELELSIRTRPSGPVSLKQIVDVWPDAMPTLLILEGDTVLDTRLVTFLAEQASATALVDSAVPLTMQQLVLSVPATSKGKLCGAAVLKHDWASSQDVPFSRALCQGVDQGSLAALDIASQPLYSKEMRRELRPFWFPAPAPANKKLAERILLDSAQKGTLDFPAQLHAPIEQWLVFHLCRTSLRPNQLTTICNIVAWIATYFFATGHLVWGTGIALVVGVLDGLDGKQARLKVETSKSGKWEHWFDAIFEWSWWTALAYHFRISGELPQAFGYLFLLLGAEAVDALAKGSVLFTYGKLIDELSPFDRLIRLVGGRRNIYIWILAVGVLLGNAATAFVVMAWWEVVTAAVHIPRAIWAVWHRRRRLPADVAT
jgi:phosphatidylglycerophosphate synthase